MEENLGHRPYTSVRQLFYNYPAKIKQSNALMKSSKSTPCLEKYYDKRETQTGTLINGKQGQDRRIVIKPISKSILFHSSYSDFYCENPPEMKCNLKEMSLLSRSENKLNTCVFNRFDARVRSFDPVKCRNLQSVFFKTSFEDTYKEYEIYDDTDSCYKSPAADDPTEKNAYDIQGKF